MTTRTRPTQPNMFASADLPLFSQTPQTAHAETFTPKPAAPKQETLPTPAPAKTEEQQAIDAERAQYASEHTDATPATCPDCGSRKAFTRDIRNMYENRQPYYTHFETVCHKCGYYEFLPYTQN